MVTKGTSTGRMIGVMLLLCGIGVAGYFGYRSYELSKLRQSVLPDVKGVSLRLARAIAPPGNATWKEIFESREGDIRLAGDSMLKLQSLTTESNERVLKPIAAYLASGQDFLRASLASTRASFSHSTSLNAYVRAVGAWVDSSGYTETMMRKIMDDAEAASKEAASGLRRSQEDLLKSGAALLQRQALISRDMPKDSLISPSDFQRYLDDLTAEMKKLEKSNKDFEESRRKLSDTKKP